MAKSGGNELTPANEPERSDVKHQTQPASQWREQVEGQLTEVSTRRRELRRQIAEQREERRTSNLQGEDTLCLRSAHQLARAKILGEEWQRAVHDMKHAGQRVRISRERLNRLESQKRMLRERSARWTYWMSKAPYLAWKTLPLRKELSRADNQRRDALKALRTLRPAENIGEVRARILELTGSLLVSDERLRHSIQCLQKADQSLSAEISEALRLSPELRALGERPVTMEQRVDHMTRALSIPKPVTPLVPVVAAKAQRSKVRLM